MKNGYYLFAYVEINKYANYYQIDTKRHDQNISLWEYFDGNLTLLRYWELERLSRIKHHNKAFSTKEQFIKFVNQLLSQFDLDDSKLVGIHAPPYFELVETPNYIMSEEYNYHSLCSARFRWVKAPTSPELTQLTHTIAHRVGRYLERQGLLERDVENSYLASDAVDDDPMTPLLGHSITYRIAVGSQAGRKVFTLQTLPTSGDPFGDGIGKVAGSSLHAGVAARADERKKLERLCRYISRPAVSEKRLSLTRGGNVRYQLKTPYRDGTTHVIFEPLDFIARLAALVPKPRVNLTRFHGVFAPNSRHRALVTPAKRGRGNKVRVADEPATPAQRRASMTWAQRLKRVFNIDIETCSGCGGAMKVIACIEDPIVIKQILDHLKHKAETSGTRALPESRAPPAELLLGLFD